MKFVYVSPASATPLVSLQTTKKSPSLGALYLGAQVKSLCDFYIIDAFNNFLSLDEAVEKIHALQPDYVGFGVNFSSVLNFAVDAAKIIKTRWPGIKIVFGGNVSTYRCEELIKQDYVDYVFLNEAETSFRKFVENIIQGRNNFDDIDGLAYKRDGNMVVRPHKTYIQQLDNLPLPDFSLLQAPEDYTASIISSRGCPYDCFYCSTKQMWGTTWRRRSAEHILSEIVSLRKQLKTREIEFCDDNFLVDKNRFRELVRLLLLRKIKIITGFSARVELIDAEVLELAGKINVQGIFLGIESGSERVLKKMNRRYSVEDIYRISDLCLKHGVIPIASFMIGLPFETEADALETLKVMRKISTPKIQIHICMPLVGTDIFNNPAHYGVKIDYPKALAGLIDDVPAMHTSAFTPKQVMEYYLAGLGIVQEKLGSLWKYQKKKVVQNARIIRS